MEQNNLHGKCLLATRVVSTNPELSSQIENGLQGIKGVFFGGTFLTWQSALSSLKNGIYEFSSNSLVTHIFIVDHDERKSGGLNWLPGASDSLTRAMFIIRDLQ
ncbi:MAG: hypothetical protein M1339_00115 [Bacteroidetes bacterium]|nr:hypothetical protein [Bacteroidota bacterium]